MLPYVPLLIDMAVGEGWPGGHGPNILADNLTLSQPGGQIIPITMAKSRGGGGFSDLPTALNYILMTSNKVHLSLSKENDKRNIAGVFFTTFKHHFLCLIQGVSVQKDKFKIIITIGLSYIRKHSWWLACSPIFSI